MLVMSLMPISARKKTFCIGTGQRWQSFKTARRWTQSTVSTVDRQSLDEAATACQVRNKAIHKVSFVSQQTLLSVFLKATHIIYPLQKTQ